MVNPTFGRVRYPYGRESTVATSDLALYPQVIPTGDQIERAAIPYAISSLCQQVCLQALVTSQKAGLILKGMNIRKRFTKMLVHKLRVFALKLREKIFTQIITGLRSFYLKFSRPSEYLK